MDRDLTSLVIPYVACIVNDITMNKPYLPNKAACDDPSFLYLAIDSSTMSLDHVHIGYERLKHERGVGRSIG